MPHRVNLALQNLSWRNALIVIATAIALANSACSTSKRSEPLLADGTKPLVVMAFDTPLPLDPLPKGWYHRKFFAVDPMAISFATHQGRSGIRLATDNSASMLYRYTDIALNEYRQLDWGWLVEKGIDSDIDETTEAGDDHPARLYLKFAAPDGQTRAMEIIWGNRRLHRGDWKYLGEPDSKNRFPHYVARGGEAQTGRWHDESVDLIDLYESQWGSAEGVRLIELALFCDTDATGGQSSAYFSMVTLQ